VALRAGRGFLGRCRTVVLVLALVVVALEEELLDLAVDNFTAAGLA
jgi:hypothetical protein